MTLNRSVDRPPKHGEVKVIFTTKTEPQTIGELLDAAVVEEDLKRIDRDYYRGGFSSYPRHARR